MTVGEAFAGAGAGDVLPDRRGADGFRVRAAVEGLVDRVRAGGAAVGKNARCPFVRYWYYLAYRLLRPSWIFSPESAGKKR
ncbi:MAG: hypothetical protein AAB581_03160 [Patescibacteria group bacterium]